MRAWLEERSSQERMILLLGALVLGGALHFLFLLEPLMQGNAALRTRIAAESDLKAHLEQVAGEVRALGPVAPAAAPAGAAPRSLVTVLTSTAQAAGVQPYTRRMTPIGPQALSVFVEAVPFTVLAPWLVELAAQHGVAVEQAAVTASAAGSGLVDAQLTLRAQGG